MDSVSQHKFAHFDIGLMLSVQHEDEEIWSSMVQSVCMMPDCDTL